MIEPRRLRDPMGAKGREGQSGRQIHGRSRPICYWPLRPQFEKCMWSLSQVGAESWDLGRSRFTHHTLERLEQLPRVRFAMLDTTELHLRTEPTMFASAPGLRKQSSCAKCNPWCSIEPPISPSLFCFIRIPFVISSLHFLRRMAPTQIYCDESTLHYSPFTET